MPKVSQQHWDERRDFILEAAARCFAREGFHATSIADVIHESGLSAGSVYRYFKNKDDLIQAIVERYLGQILSGFKQISQTVTDPAEAVIQTIHLVARNLKGTPPHPFASLLPQIWAEAMRNPDIHKRVKSSYSTLLNGFQTLAQQHRNNPPGVTPDGTSRVALSLLLGFILQALLFSNDLNEEECAHNIRALFPAKP